MASPNKQISYTEWKETTHSSQRVMAIATTAGAGGARIYDHILYPKKRETKEPFQEHTKPIHRDVAVQTELQHDIILYSCKKKPAFMPWRMSVGDNSDSDDDTYYRVHGAKLV